MSSKEILKELLTEEHRNIEKVTFEKETVFIETSIFKPTYSSKHKNVILHHKRDDIF